ncbi:MAG TPA: oxalate/formate MFS antiporter [Casimicrobiaceae bacterium]|nr:oxalate/formate MFS antiporter [Thermoanaerobaculia bacterium]HLX27113.1 oxalate/formate MFS antiporter [Casimicrobiaceae bacterium]
MSTVLPDTALPSTYVNRWWQMLLGFVAMMSISSPQYTWTLFIHPLEGKLNATLAQLQVTFSLLIVLQTFCSPIQAWLVDRFGPRLLISIGCALSGLSWVLSSYVDNIWSLYFTYGIIGGFGTGIVYVGIIGHMVRWFPDRRGFAAGIAAAGYGAGAILTSFPIADMIPASGYAHTLFIWGWIQLVIGVIVSQGFRIPAAGWKPAAADLVTRQADRQSRHSYRAAEMLRTPVFWLMFIMMSMMATSGLMVVSQVGPFASDYGVKDTLVLGLAALPLSLTLSRATNGITRPFFGWVSDHIGRENTMFVAFSLEAAAILLLLVFAHNAAVFVVLTGLVFFGWGEIFSLFPSTLTDLFGTRYATTNYGFLYIAQGVGSVLGGPVAAYIREASGSWTTVFVIVIVLDVITALLAVLVLKGMRTRWIARSAAPAG